MGSAYSPLLASDEEIERPISLGQKAAYGVGHVLNDICAALWFSYILLFLQTILGLPAPVAGGLMLLGAS